MYFVSWRKAVQIKMHKYTGEYKYLKNIGCWIELLLLLSDLLVLPVLLLTGELTLYLVTFVLNTIRHLFTFLSSPVFSHAYSKFYKGNVLCEHKFIYNFQVCIIYSLIYYDCVWIEYYLKKIVLKAFSTVYYPAIF